MDSRRTPGLSTRAVHAGDAARTRGGPAVNPIVQSSTFFSDPAAPEEVRYTRYGNNPNHSLLEARIAALEGAEACAVFGSGMATIAAVLLSRLGTGDHVLAARALYGGTRALLERELARLGIESSFVDFAAEPWQERLRSTTRLMLVELPTNPLLRVLDLRPIAEQACSRGLTLAVDATFATPINLRPLEHGADLVVHSATKYLGGHSDVTGGAVAGSSELLDAIRGRARMFGAVLDPHAAWLIERGIKTLAVRMERHNRNGLQVAEWCESQPEIERVYYPGLASDPDHQLAARLLDGFGGMLGIILRGGGAAAERFVRALRLAKVAPSLGGVDTLVSEPRHTSHASLDLEQRRALGIPDGFLRFSLGIEDAEDIIADIEGALHAI